MKQLLRFAGLLLALFAPLVSAQNADWHREFPGFKIAGNLYYVGTADLAVYLIKTPKGNILINSDFPQDLPLIRNSIHQLGFDYRDTRILLISHAHDDHDGAVGQIKKETGASLMVMQGDVASVESTAEGQPGAKVDRVLHDGDTVELGGSKLTARLTPGHTPGCTTWTMEVQENGRKLNAVLIGSPNVNPGYILVGNKNYPRIAEDYEKTFNVLLSLPVDFFLGAHGSYFGLKEKYEKMKAGGANPFIDPDGYNAYVTERRDAFRKEWDRQKQHPGSHNRSDDGRPNQHDNPKQVPTMRAFHESSIYADAQFRSSPYHAKSQ
ncbi:MAG TPA: subclass B3 metallo-beta-lactamase [Verrucomicrobiae bacterium]|nr:subclass B3 metallo-beta-lactamase [Verrucomicrobiae bacterium]